MRRLQANSWEQKSRFGLQSRAQQRAAGFAGDLDRRVDPSVYPCHFLTQGVSVAQRHLGQSLLAGRLAVDVDRDYGGIIAHGSLYYGLRTNLREIIMQLK